MKICKEGHNEICYVINSCPLCELHKHNNEVHDFIEALGVESLLTKWQDRQELDTDGTNLRNFCEDNLIC